MIFSVNLSSDILDKLRIYRENFEKAYLEATEEFYKTQAAAYLQENGVQNYMKYVRIDKLLLSPVDDCAHQFLRGYDHNESNPNFNFNRLST